MWARDLLGLWGLPPACVAGVSESPAPSTHSLGRGPG